MYIYSNICKYMHVYIYIYTYIHMYVYIYIYWNDRWPLCLWAKTSRGTYINRLGNYIFLSWKLFNKSWKLYCEIWPVAVPMM